MTSVEAVWNHLLPTEPGRVLHAVCECQGTDLPTVALCGWVCTHEIKLSIADEDKCAVCLDLVMTPRTCCGWNPR